jgi:hypothetical protein
MYWFHFSVFYSDVQKFLPVTSTFCSPQICGRVRRIPVFKSWMWETYFLWKSAEIWTVDEMWITYELKDKSHFRIWFCLQFVLSDTCDYLSRMWSAKDWNPGDPFQSGANRSVFSSQIDTVRCEIWGCHIGAGCVGCAGVFSRYEWWLVPDIPWGWHLHQHGCVLTNTPAGSTKAIADTDDLIDMTLKYTALTASACSLYPTGVEI